MRTKTIHSRWLRTAVFAFYCFAASPMLPAVRADITWALALHGGAGTAPGTPASAEDAQRRAALKEALSMGAAILSSGDSSLDAVEAVIRSLEDHPLFNAGRGAVFAKDGSHELDASIMNGRDRACGAVASIKTARHPITVARLVMEKTDHVLLVGTGADDFAERMRVAMVDNRFFDTDARRAKWLKKKGRQEEGGSTVGCVALDLLGNLAAGTSTGGLTNKMAGRVGDSPIIGAGTYADNATCAVSCTGKGEHFIRHAVAYDIAARMVYQQQPLEASVDAVFKHRLQPGWGGLIAVDSSGAICMKFNTKGMARAAADSAGRFEVLWGVEGGVEGGVEADAPAEENAER